MPYGVSIWGPIAASAVGGYLSHNNEQQQTQSSSQAPFVPPQYRSLRDMILAQAMSRLSAPTDVSGYTANGLAANNRAFRGSKQALDNELAARGMSGSPVAASGAATLESGRAASGSQFLNSVPLTLNDLLLRNMGAANDVLRSGTGSTSSGTGTATQQSGGGAAGSFENVAAMLGYLSAKGAFGAKKPGATDQTPSIFGAPTYAPVGGY